ncbi:MAG TPA: hypothetical protein VJN20_02820, partial [Burkholderiales bacterium]|nr:hypothetical protein [Burkholderiales bacterium]
SVARRLVVRSGLAVQLRAVPKGFEQQIAQLRGQIPDTVYASLQRAGKEAFRPEGLQAEIERSLPEKLKLAEMQKALAWLETQAGRRVTLAEEASSATLDEASLKKYAEQSKGKPVSARRRQLLQDLITATAAVDSTANLIEATSLGVAIGMESTQPVQKRAGVAALRAQIQKAMPRDELKKTLAASLPGIYAYTYREVSEADLAAYLAFLRGADGKKYNDAMVEAFSQALVAASVRMGQLVDQTEKRPT